jgi:hypothetical protein
MTKIYALFYDCDNGNREDWNIFYTPLELFATAEERAARIAYIKSKASDPELDFEERDLELTTDTNALIDRKVMVEDDDDEDAFEKYDFDDEDEDDDED